MSQLSMPSKTIRSELIRSTAILSALVATAAFDASLASVMAQTATQGAALEEIIVTARKREENLKEIPDSITALTASAIQSARINDVKDVAARVPNLSIVEAQQPGVALINIRGVGQARNGEPSVAVVIDGVQLTNAYGITQDLFDIERIEVLKGPQGATYGRNAIGGAINITTKQPTNDLAGSVLASYGSANDVRLNGSLSGPIIEDKLLFRIAGSFRSFDGDVDSLFTPGRDEANWQDDRNIRAALLAKPTDNISIDLRYSRLETKSGAAWYAVVPPGTNPDKPRPYLGDYPSSAKRILNDASGKIDIDFDNMVLTSVTAFSKVSSSINEDIDFTPLDGLTAEQDLNSTNWSQEVRLASSGDSPFKWMGGVYYLNTDQKLDTEIFLGRDFFPIFGLPPTTPSPLPFAATRATDKNDAYAGFGQLIYRFNSGIELTAAARYDVDKRHQLDRVLLQNFDKTFKSLQPKASITYFFNGDESMVYGTVAKGFRSGGVNPSALITRYYKKEENWNFELGFKTSLLDRRVSMSGAAFYTRIKDRQVYILDINNSTQILTNPIPSSEVYGLEFDITARPVPDLDVSAAIGLTDSKIRTYDTSVFAGQLSAGNFTGNKLPQVAAISYAFSAQYRIAVNDDTMVIPRFELNGSGGAYYWEIDNLNRRHSVMLGNARLTLEHKGLAVTGYVENMFNEHYVLEYVPARWSGSGSGDVSAAARGRHYGIQARFQF
ncbi:TonB-dependent receptor [Govanella unica]|uniref:TonB-dependent receptor n=1 Tax=Govanella unica TaxID=2975056 RepID=A0A9X3TZ01_9PROT|nr:TonB-dependent receptor [Govania unica]MDA5194540.1 TonB-dependent receptor [Govania unica]